MSALIQTSNQTSIQATKFGSGQTVHRIEDAALLQGQGRFADDVSAPGPLDRKSVG